MVAAVLLTIAIATALRAIAAAIVRTSTGFIAAVLRVLRTFTLRAGIALTVRLALAMLVLALCLAVTLVATTATALIAAAALRTAIALATLGVTALFAGQLAGVHRLADEFAAARRNGDADQLFNLTQEVAFIRTAQ